MIDFVTFCVIIVILHCSLLDKRKRIDIVLLCSCNIHNLMLASFVNRRIIIDELFFFFSLSLRYNQKLLQVLDINDYEIMNEQQLHRSHSAKYRAPPPPPPSCAESLSILPEPFISSLRQLFSILDKTNSGYVPFNVFKCYFDSSSTKLDFLNELESESQLNNNLITFDLLINVIKRSVSFTKHPPPPPPPPPPVPPIRIPTARRPLNRSTSVLVVTPKPKKLERQIPIVYRSSNDLEMNNSNASNPLYYNRTNRIDFPMV